MGLSLRRKDFKKYIRVHLCTLAIAVSFNSTWRVVRDSYRYGGIQYMLLYTIATLIIALPLTLLQLAIGQLCQQDAVGVWRAVPIFKGIGYIRILISFLSAMYTSIYEAITISVFLYTVRSPIPFVECSQYLYSENGYQNLFNSSHCLSETFLAPVQVKLEYYLAVAFIAALIWFLFPFALFSPVKAMKRIFFILGPCIVVLYIVIISGIGSIGNLSLFSNENKWINYLEPYIWHAALTQSLISAQLGGGFLIATGDTIYHSTHVMWSSIILIGVNLLSSWFGVLMFYSIEGSEDKDTSLVAVLVQIYKFTETKQNHIIWTFLLFLLVITSGFVTLVTLFYPLFDRFRRIHDGKWRIFTIFSSIVGYGLSMAALAKGLPVIGLIDDVAVPFLVTTSAVLEIVVFVFIYGWKALVKDIEFLINDELKIFWVLSWCAEPGIIVPFTVWWMIMTVLGDQSWRGIAMYFSIGLFSFIVTIFAVITVAKQVQFDFISKLKSSFSPATHWGPRDPITHYYWSNRRREDLRRDTLSLWNRDISSVEDYDNIHLEDAQCRHQKRKSKSYEKYLAILKTKRLRKSDKIELTSRCKPLKSPSKSIKSVTFQSNEPRLL